MSSVFKKMLFLEHTIDENLLEKSVVGAEFARMENVQATAKSVVGADVAPMEN